MGQQALDISRIDIAPRRETLAFSLLIPVSEEPLQYACSAFEVIDLICSKKAESIFAHQTRLIDFPNRRKSGRSIMVN
jgi:hypothetical protein